MAIFYTSLSAVGPTAVVGDIVERTNGEYGIAALILLGDKKVLFLLSSLMAR